MSNPARSEIKADIKENGGIFSPLTKLNLVILCVIGLFYAALSLTEFLPSIVAMLAASLIVTYLLLGPVNALERLITRLIARIAPKRLTISAGLCRALSIIVVYLLCLGLLVFGVLKIAVPLSRQFKEFARDLPSHISKVKPESGGKPTKLIRQTWLEKSTEQVGDAKIQRESQISVTQPVTKRPKTKILTASVTLAMQKISALSKSYASRLGRYALDVGTTTLNSLIYTLTTLVLVFYLLHDGPAIKRGLIDLMPTRHEARAKEFFEHLHKQFYTMIKGQVLMAVLSGGTMYCLLLAVGLKYALLLGVVYGVASILPVIGPWLGLIPIAVIIELGHNPINILPVLVVAGLFYLTKAYWLWPKLISREFEIHPILFILTFLACIKVVGFSGVFLSFPLASILGVWLDFRRERKHQPLIQVEPGI